MAHVQDIPVSKNMILKGFMIYHMKVHMVSYNFSQKKSKSKIHILPNYEQMDLKTAIVREVRGFILQKVQANRAEAGKLVAF